MTLTNDLAKKIGQLDKKERMLLLEKMLQTFDLQEIMGLNRLIDKMIRKKEKSQLKRVARMMRKVYEEDTDLTAFTKLDGEDFYETR